MKGIYLIDGKRVAVVPNYFSRNLTINSNQTTTLLTHNTLTVTPSISGNYKVDVNYIWSHNSGGTDFISELRQDNATLVRQRHEPQDTAGTGVTSVRLDNGANLDTGTDQRYPAMMTDIVTLTKGVQYDFTFVFAGSTTFDIPAVYRSLITLGWFNE